MTSDVLLLGAYGLAGRAILEKLVSLDIRVAAAGRNAEKLERVVAQLRPTTGIETFILEIKDEHALTSKLSKTNIVVNAIGPYLEHGERIADAAIQTGTHYIDIASEQQHYRNLRRLSSRARDRGLLLGVGFGLYPGISGLLAHSMLSDFKEPQDLEIYLCMGGNPKGQGDAQLLTGILELTAPLEHIKNGLNSSFTPGKSIPVDFNEKCKIQDVMLWPQLELLALAETHRLSSAESGLHIDGQPKITRAEAAITTLLSPQKYNFTKKLLLSAARWIPKNKGDGTNVHGASILVRTVNGSTSRTRILHSGNTEAATAILPALTLRHLIRTRGKTPRMSGLTLPYQWFSAVESAAIINSEPLAQSPLTG